MLHQGRNSGGLCLDICIASSFSELKLTALSSWGISEGENKCFDQGTPLLHEGEDGGAWDITPLCALVGSPGSTELTPWSPGVGTLSRRFLSFLVFSVIARTFPFAGKLVRTSSLE